MTLTSEIDFSADPEVKPIAVYDENQQIGLDGLSVFLGQDVYYAVGLSDDQNAGENQPTSE